MANYPQSSPLPLCDCHIHMALDGEDWRSAIARHRAGPDMAFIRRTLERYRQAGFTYLRDGGDKWGVGAAARRIAPEYGITYRTPLAPLCRRGHYGGFIGVYWETLPEYAALVRQAKAAGADFIKIMISGLMDFDCPGRLSEAGLDGETIAELVGIAHDLGLSVMAHANGARVVEAAAAAGVDSVEHGAYLDGAALSAMAENRVVWVPTLSTIANPRGRGRYREAALDEILTGAAENLRRFAALGGLIAPGTDAGAWAVPHGGLTEYTLLREALGETANELLSRGIEAIQERF